VWLGPCQHIIFFTSYISPDSTAVMDLGTPSTVPAMEMWASTCLSSQPGCNSSTQWRKDRATLHASQGSESGVPAEPKRPAMGPEPGPALPEAITSLSGCWHERSPWKTGYGLRSLG
jgi:hypothetical protein